jgi:solute carrier family 29 (equilibrative nucleoside transporter), member 1/2/3
MMFPIFTTVIVSTHHEPLPRLLQPDVFIPLSFIIWNFGDLVGRLVCAWPIFHVTRPKLQAFLAVARLAFIPLYYQCNLHGNGAKIGGDAFFWCIQFGYGVTNGWIGSNVMMAAPAYAGEEMREAAGGFMGACIMGGLTLGSLMGFFVSV